MYSRFFEELPQLLAVILPEVQEVTVDVLQRCPVPGINSGQIIPARGSDGSYFPVSMAWMVWRVTPKW